MAVRTATSGGLSVQVVAVLDACTDGSARICSGVPWLSMVRTDARSVGHARAAGCLAALQASSVPPERLWLACTDADSEVPIHWLLHHAALAARGYDAVLGTVEVRDWSGWRPGLRAEYEAGYRPDDGHEHVHGANLGVRGSAYLAAGGFHGRSSDEDVALVAALRRTGARVAATARAPVVTAARGVGRTPHGFAAHLSALADAR